MALGLLLIWALSGLTLAAHGSQKLFGFFAGSGPGGTAKFFASLGFRTPLLMAVIAGLGELVGGLLFAFGLLTPLAALILAVVMLNAIASAHWKRGFFSSAGGYEFNLAILATAGAITAIGPGRYSLDGALGWAETISGPWWALGVIGLAGLVAFVTLKIGRTHTPARPELPGRTVQWWGPRDDPFRPSGRGARPEGENVMTTEASAFEQSRMEIGRAAPPLHRALVTLGNQVELDPRLLELVNLRASILNGCAYCIDMHTKIARRAGESEQRLYAVAAWHEAAFFDAKERAALALTDAVTLISDEHVPRDVWDEAGAYFEPDELAQLVWAITVINAWNRIAITTQMLPAA